MTEPDVTKPASEIVRILATALEHGDSPHRFERVEAWRETLAFHGWPDRDEVTRQIGLLRPWGDTDVAFEVPGPSHTCEECGTTFRHAAGLALHRNRSKVHRSAS